MKYVDNPETAVLDAAKDMLRRGLVEGTAGNISARRADGNVVITPSSVDYRDMQLDDLVLIDADGSVLQASEGRSPSSEMQLHLACYRAFDDVGSVRFTLFLAVVAGVPAAIVFLQPDLGTSLVYSAVLAAILFLVGVPWSHFATAGSIFSGVSDGAYRATTSPRPFTRNLVKFHLIASVPSRPGRADFSSS